MEKQTIGESFKQRFRNQVPGSDEGTATEIAAKNKVPPGIVRKLIQRAGIKGRKPDDQRDKYYIVAEIEELLRKRKARGFDDAKALMRGSDATLTIGEHLFPPNDSDSLSLDVGFNRQAFIDQALAGAIQNATKSYRRYLMKQIGKADALDDEDLQLELTTHYVKAQRRVGMALIEMVESYSDQDTQEEEAAS